MKEIFVLAISNYIGNVNPVRGFLVTVLSLVLGITARDISVALEIIAFMVSVLVGLVTLYHLLKNKLHWKILNRRKTCVEKNKKQ